MKVDELKRLKELEQENARLKRIVADQRLEIDIKDSTNKCNFWDSKTAPFFLEEGPKPSPLKWINVRLLLSVQKSQ
jgi:hypothetical protein